MPARPLLLALMLCLCAPAAAELPARSSPLGDGTVAAVVDGRTLRLADGREVRLIGLAPPSGTGGEATDMAAAALAALVLDRPITLRKAGRDRVGDRYGRVLAHLLRADDGLWIQAELVRQGAAAVEPAAEQHSLIPALLAAEAEARAEGRGIWAPGGTLRPADSLSERTDAGGFRVVEGRVLAASRRGEMVYLNFGQDWRRDFTVEVAARDLRRFTAAGLDPLALSGQRIRVRGWVELRNGPAIRATHPQQIERLPP